MKAILALVLAGKLGQVIMSGGSMLVSIFAYAFIYGWKYAIGFVAMLFAHESGHYLAAKQRGMKVGAPTFIPFVGAWIDLKEQPMNAETEAYVGIAGPMSGSVAAFLCYVAGHSSGSQLLLAISYAGFVLNLFNLIPITPLDGGRIVAAISPRIWFLGAPLLVALFFWKPSPLLLLIALFAAPQMWRVLRNKDVLSSRYYQTPLAVRMQYTAQYVLLGGFLAVMAYDVHQGLLDR